ncbi:MAG: bifunctional YncE family protein/alkaline phosphatase family protein [Planctomycetes bacterium]|nr:bifunctional YncE family protein/alkaline phosphatase family protein [Planctomycetota bacterium]
MFKPLVIALAAFSVSAQDFKVGPADGGTITSTGQMVRPAGLTMEFAGRPVDLARSPDGALLAAKDNRGVVLFNAASLEVLQEISFGEDGPSMVGLAFSRDGGRLYATDCKNSLVELTSKGETASWEISRRMALPGPNGKGEAFPCGVAIDAATAYVCLSRNNTLGVIDLDSGKILKQIPVGVAPYAVLVRNGRAFVSNWGGRVPKEGERAADSSGTPALIDSRGVAASGSISIIDLAAGREFTQVETGLSACGLALSRDGSTLYVANANADTVSVVDTATASVKSQISTRPDPALPFGSMPNGLALSADERTLYVSNAGNNAVAVISLADNRVQGLIPTGWYPGPILTAGDPNHAVLLVGNIKGVGSRTRDPARKGFNSRKHRGSVSRIDIPDEAGLRTLTAQAREDARVPQILKAAERSSDAAAAVPVPAHPGQPSTIEHVVYIIKENRTYDQVFGAIGKGNGDPALCVYGREITANHHALAEQFVLLDNYYCNGVLSADGHSWATEGNVTPYLERSFGGFKRSYTFGDDPLTYSSSGFIWDHVLAAGFSFRNYGEFDNAGTEPKSRYKAVFEDHKSGANAIALTHNIGIENLRRYTHPGYPGWCLDIPDQVRASIFLGELAEFEKGENGKTLPNFVLVHLPNDHTAGASAKVPTPRSMVADNDVALGRIVDGLTHSRFWSKMCIIVIEDDPQDGWDHVDGHRSICLIASPFAKRGAVVSNFYNQSSVLHTIERIFGLVGPNQLLAAAPVMSDCFTGTPDFTPFTAVANPTPLCEFTTANSMAAPRDRELERLTATLDFSKPDVADEATLNRVLWLAARADTPYPKELAGAHGRGLAALGLKLDGRGDVDDDD